MNKELREKANEYHVHSKTLDELITLIRTATIEEYKKECYINELEWMLKFEEEVAPTIRKAERNATLDDMQTEVDEIEKSELWAQMGIPAECHCVYIEKFEEAIDKLRGVNNG